MKKGITYLFLFLAGASLAQVPVRLNDHQLDSLRSLVKTAKEDTNKVNLMTTLGMAMADIEKEPDMPLLNGALALSEKLKYTQGMANAYHVLGMAYRDLNENQKALENYERSLKANEITGNRARTSKTLNNIGNIFFGLSNYEEAMKYHLKALKIREEMNDQYGIATSCMNLGIATAVTDKQEALRYYFRAIEVQDRIDDKIGKSRTLDNIGSCYKGMGDFPKALEYFNKALELKQGIATKRSIANSLNNLGGTYLEWGADNGKALELFQESLKLKKETKDIKGQANCYINIGQVYLKSNNPEKALENFRIALPLSNKVEHLEGVTICHLGLSQVFKALKQNDSAYHYLVQHNKLKKSMLNSQNRRNMSEMQVLYDTEKKNRQITELNLEKELNDTRLTRQRTIIASASTGLILVLLLAFFIFRGYRQKQLSEKLLEEKNRLIEEQNALVQEKNKNITDSINYAQRIQSSILPPDRLVNELLPDSFVLYLPKDIVSGDFYWLEKSKDKVLFAAVDCTGHGVPGAMMSVLGFNLLSQAVSEKGLTKPSDILRHLDSGVNTMLRQSTETNTVKDGMDLALCTLDFAKKELQYAGAYNGLWVVKGANGQEANRQLVEIKADKSPIGVNVDGVVDNYTNHTLQLEKGDCIYIFSDGYADQFGGPRGKKFKYKAMKELLVFINNHSMKEQKEMLESAFTQWRGELEQVDDVLVIGVRV